MTGKWIFLVDKLPTEVAPPAMSLHYAKCKDKEILYED